MEKNEKPIAPPTPELYGQTVHITYAIDTTSSEFVVTETLQIYPIIARDEETRALIEKTYSSTAYSAYREWCLGNRREPLTTPSRGINAGTMLFDSHGNILLIRKQYKNPDGSLKYMLDIPAGGSNQQQRINLEHTAARETFGEETVMIDRKTGQILLPNHSGDHVRTALKSNIARAHEIGMNFPDQAVNAFNRVIQDDNAVFQGFDFESAPPSIFDPINCPWANITIISKNGMPINHTHAMLVVHENGADALFPVYVDDLFRYMPVDLEIMEDGTPLARGHVVMNSADMPSLSAGNETDGILMINGNLITERFSSKEYPLKPLLKSFCS